MTSRATLGGDSVDLMILAELFPPHQDPLVASDGTRYNLTSAQQSAGRRPGLDG